MTTPVLETKALCKSFGALQVADEINFRLMMGSRHALIGPADAHGDGPVDTVFVHRLYQVLCRRQLRLGIGE
ncbi:MAG: hypothetical protein IH787_08335 [Nitrospirae bacterium]|nr:hypothetical protein [Nitrospirota bacterium]